jgi:hypothetical protein
MILFEICNPRSSAGRKSSAALLWVEKQTHKDILHWLATQGYICQLPTLECRCKQWGFTRRGLSTEPDARFHTTFDNDQTIAEQLNTLGYPITGATVKNTRLANGWRHRQVTSAQGAEAWEETFA